MVSTPVRPPPHADNLLSGGIVGGFIFFLGTFLLLCPRKKTWACSGGGVPLVAPMWSFGCCWVGSGPPARSWALVDAATWSDYRRGCEASIFLLLSVPSLAGWRRLSSRIRFGTRPRKVLHLPSHKSCGTRCSAKRTAVYCSTCSNCVCGTNFDVASDKPGSKLVLSENLVPEAPARVLRFCGAFTPPT